ncbi:MAG: hypothetical protein OEZ36_07150 [Spirochaetota bacterium]|nr:hypothetical protein [Spirochaetota bacterium]
MDINSYLLLLPHDKPIRMVSKILEISDKHSETICQIDQDNPFLKDNGILSELANIELIAQTAAIMLIFNRYENKGFSLEELLRIKENENNLGFLVTISNLSFLSQIMARDNFRVRVDLNNHIDDYYAFSGMVYMKDILVAKGDMTIYAE